MSVENTLTQFVSNELLDGEVVNVDDNLLSDGMVDSVGMVRLATFLIDELGVTVPAEDFTIDNFRSINVLSEYVARRLQECEDQD